MRLLCDFFQSSIGKKLMVASAGLLLCGFLITHLAGNLFLFAGEGPFNHYAEVLESNPLLPLAELALAGLFLLHIILSLTVTCQNKQARPVGYEMKQSKKEGGLSSTTMAASGTFLLLFLVIHIKTFKFGDAGDGLFKLVTESFGNLYYSLFYVLAMGALGLHLGHGVQSAFQTFGVNHPKYTPLIKKAGLAFALIIAGTFAVIPIWAYVKGGCR